MRTRSVGDNDVLFDFSIDGDTLTLTHRSRTDPRLHVPAGHHGRDVMERSQAVVPLESRAELPPLENGEVAACVDLCGAPSLYGR